MVEQGKVAPPSEDKRWRVVGATMRRLGYRPDALIETLHSVQESFGFLDEEALRYIATTLRLPLSRVYGVATFYDFFRLKPRGEHHTCVICVGTACHLKGAAEILSEVEVQTGMLPGGSSSDGKVSLLTARCLASCGLAPAGVFDGKVVGKLTAADTLQRIRKWTQHES